MAHSKIADLSLDDDNYILAVAIDFGTTYSGYAFSFKTRPDEISMNKNWGASSGFQTYKTPTSVLTGPQDELVAFGHEAEYRYGQMVEEGTDTKKFHLFRHFKMLLHQKGVSLKSKVTSTDGAIRPAIDIFTLAVRYLKEHVLHSLSLQVKSPPNASHIRWVVTVPAIWTEEAKAFMREAVYRAGCVSKKNSKKLVICLEPEAASLYCRNLNLDKFTNDIQMAPSFKPQTKYIVVDAGGGTIDIACHEILANEDIKEIHIATGGAWGGTSVDQAFVHLLQEILGTDFLNAYILECPQQWLTFLSSFERQKKSVNPLEPSKIVVALQWSMQTKMQEMCGKNIESFFKKSQYKGITCVNGSLVLSHELCLSLFQGAVKDLCSHIKEVFKVSHVSESEYLMLVGGFGESQVLYHSIKALLPKTMNLLIPDEAQLAIIKGAVCFGHEMDQIKTRIARKTYGVQQMKLFNPEIHDASKKYDGGGGQIWCKDLFGLLIKKGSPCEIGQSQSLTHVPVDDNQKMMTLSIYCSDRQELRDVEYIDSTWFEKLGSVTVQMPDTKGKNLDRNVSFAFNFGRTAIEVKAKDLTSGNEAETTIDFLSNAT